MPTPLDDFKSSLLRSLFEGSRAPSGSPEKAKWEAAHYEFHKAITTPLLAYLKAKFERFNQQDREDVLSEVWKGVIRSPNKTNAKVRKLVAEGSVDKRQQITAILTKTSYWRALDHLRKQDRKSNMRNDRVSLMEMIAAIDEELKENDIIDVETNQLITCDLILDGLLAEKKRYPHNVAVFRDLCCGLSPGEIAGKCEVTPQKIYTLKNEFLDQITAILKRLMQHPSLRNAVRATRAKNNVRTK